MSVRTGIVKWFNNKAGYGFLTDSDDNTDVFVHHSALITKEKHYNYLIEGEYVHYKIEETTQGDHQFQATNVTGINEGLKSVMMDGVRLSIRSVLLVKNSIKIY